MRGFTETSPLRFTINFLHNLSAEEIISIVEESVKVEQIWVRNSALPNKLVGMNQDLMCQYVKFVADLLLHDLTGCAHYKVVNPFRLWTRYR